MQPYIRQYQPVSLIDIAGQSKQINELKQFIVNFKKEKKNAIFLYGPSGVGKTSSVIALAADLGLELCEVNASDFRNKEQIEERVGGALKQQSLFSKGKVILVDEVDGLSGKDDRGGVAAIVALIKEAAFPVVLTATNPWEHKFSKLRSNSTLLKFEHMDYKDIAFVLKRICDKEQITCSDELINTLARRAGGDCRAAINNLQELAQVDKKITKESIETLSERNQQDTIHQALTKVFKTTDPKIAISAFDNIKEDFDERFLWLDKNLPMEYTKPKDLARAYDALSRADVFKRRIRRWQHWRFLVYVNALMSLGVSSAKDEKYKGFVDYKPTGRLLKMFWAKQKSMKKRAIAEKLARRTHTSNKRALQSIDYFKPIFKKNKKMAEAISEELELEKEEVAWLKK